MNLHCGGHARQLWSGLRLCWRRRPRRRVLRSTTNQRHQTDGDNQHRSLRAQIPSAHKPGLEALRSAQFVSSGRRYSCGHGFLVFPPETRGARKPMSLRRPLRKLPTPVLSGSGSRVFLSPAYRSTPVSITRLKHYCPSFANSIFLLVCRAPRHHRYSWRMGPVSLSLTRDSSSYGTPLINSPAPCGTKRSTVLEWMFTNTTRQSVEVPFHRTRS